MAAMTALRKGEPEPTRVRPFLTGDTSCQHCSQIFMPPSRGEYLLFPWQRKTLRNKDIGHVIETVQAQGWGQSNYSACGNCALYSCQSRASLCSQALPSAWALSTGRRPTAFSECVVIPQCTAQVLPMIFLLENKIKTCLVLDWGMHRVTGWLDIKVKSVPSWRDGLVGKSICC